MSPPMSERQYLIRADQPFRCIQSCILPDGTVEYTEGLTPEAYAKERGFPVRVIDDAELDRLIAEKQEAMKSDPVQITEERYDQMLNMLPPARFHTIDGFEVFHMCEHLDGAMVDWFAQGRGRYWTFTDTCFAKDAELLSKLRKAEANV